MSVTSLPGARHFSKWTGFTPKLITAIRSGYRLTDLKTDALAGLTVAVVALPLSMAIAISSGVSPDRGLFTSIVAGFLISAFGGSMHQIGGPTAAFIVVVANIVAHEGYDGLAIATAMAGLLLIIAGMLKFGSLVRFVPHTVVTGFTSGIALSIFASQWRDLLGLHSALPADFIPKVGAVIAHAGETRWQTLAVTAASLILIVLIRRFRPRWPVFLVAVGIVTLWVGLIHFDVETITSKFGGVPRTLPAPHLPEIDLSRLVGLLPDTFTIAFLAAVESLLSCVVADGMAGRRHRSNIELIAQGLANIGSVLFGGISATGAIARTATNIRSGGRTPVSGILHALFVALFMAVLAPLLGYIPLAALASVLVLVAWGISEVRHVTMILTRQPITERIVLVVTFVLTVIENLTIGIAAGLILSALFYYAQRAHLLDVK